MKLLLFASLAVCTFLADSASFAQKMTIDKTAQSRLEQQVDSSEQMQRLLAETAEAYRQAKSFRIVRKTVDKVQSDLSNMTDVTLTSVSAASENRYRTEFKSALSWSIRQSNGRTEWVWYPWRKQYVERHTDRSSDPEGLSLAGIGFVGFLREIDKKLAGGRVQAPQTIDVGDGPVKCMVIVGPPSSNRPDPAMQAQTTYWIDEERKLLVQEEFLMRSTVPEHRYEDRRTTTYTIEINTSFPDSTFEFVPPNDAERVSEIANGPVELAGKVAPPLKLKSLDGKDFNLASLKGQPVLVDFWATWCMPCRASMPQLAKLFADFKDKGLAVVSVSKDEYPADAARYVAKYKYSWVQVADPNGETEANWGSFGIPHLILIGKDGKVLIESDGFDEKEDAKIRTVLQLMNGISAE